MASLDITPRVTEIHTCGEVLFFILWHPRWQVLLMICWLLKEVGKDWYVLCAIFQFPRGETYITLVLEHRGQFDERRKHGSGTLFPPNIPPAPETRGCDPGAYINRWFPLVSLQSGHLLNPDFWGRFLGRSCHFSSGAQPSFLWVAAWCH